MEFAYFLNRGLISLVVVMNDGKTAEAGIVGNEGFIGTPAAVGLSRSPLQAVVQITGDGFRVKVAALQNILESAPHLQLILSRYAVVQGMQVAQRPRVIGCTNQAAPVTVVANDSGQSGFRVAAHHS